MFREETGRLLRESCEQRDIEFVEIDAITFDYESSRCASPGDLLYCAGTTAAAGFVEAHLYQLAWLRSIRLPTAP